jgi:hypothetical protein
LPRQQPKAAGQVTGAPRAPQRYEIRVRGRLSSTMLRAFPALRGERQDRDTLLRGALPDQSALHGVLAEIQALGLELLEIRRLPGGPADGTEHPNV